MRESRDFNQVKSMLKVSKSGTHIFADRVREQQMPKKFREQLKISSRVRGPPQTVKMRHKQKMPTIVEKLMLKQDKCQLCSSWCNFSSMKPPQETEYQQKKVKNNDMSHSQNNQMDCATWCSQKQTSPQCDIFLRASRSETTKQYIKKDYSRKIRLQDYHYQQNCECSRCRAYSIHT